MTGEDRQNWTKTGGEVHVKTGCDRTESARLINVELRDLIQTSLSAIPWRETSSWLADTIAPRAAHSGYL